VSGEIILAVTSTNLEQPLGAQQMPANPVLRVMKATPR